MIHSRDFLDRALDALGQVLADRGQPYKAVAIGGGSLLLLGLVQRPTRDIDLVALVDPSPAFADQLDQALAILDSGDDDR